MKINGEKVCTKCLSLGPFFRDRNTSDGLTVRCKACLTEQTLAYQRAHPEVRRKAAREFNRRNPQWHTANKKAWRLAHPEADKAIVDRWREANHEKQAAHRAVRRAVQAGLLVRPDECSRCGQGGGVVHGHHEDYSKPLDVIWLCPVCHAALQRIAA